jgi:hypothetical protein
LTVRERKYFQTMWPKSGVMYITAKPGVAKSAIAKSIAKKLGFHYMDIRLSMRDETDVGLYPTISTIIVNGKETKCLDFVVPRWAVEANMQPTIIHFEELNRAQLQVRNAALQILLEREIGNDFKFNDTVLMMASGNLGEEDGTDVEEFDSALKNRLIHFSHTLGVDEWIENFAKDHCHPIIVSFIKSHPEYLYKNPTERDNAYATPRSWTFLSDFIVSNYGKGSSPQEFLPSLQEVAHGYVGNSAQRFIQYCLEMVNVSILDVLNRYDEIEKDLEKYNRDKNSELIQSLKEFDIKDLSVKQLNNVTKFLKRVGDDELTAYLLFVLDSPNIDLTDTKIRTFMQNFREVLVTIKRINKPSSK